MKTKQQKDAVTELIFQALDSGNVELYNELKEEFGFQELWEVDLEKELNKGNNAN